MSRLTFTRALLMGGRAGVVVAVVLAVTPAAASEPSTRAASVPPPVERISREIARSGARSVIVFVSAGDDEYVATAGSVHPAPNQRFRVGSVTKTFTATMVLQLVEEGKLRLSSTLGDLLPGVVPRGGEITIRQLLQHRSGLVNYTDYSSWLGRVNRSPSTRPIDLLRFSASKPLAFEPGSRWIESNTNYIALGLVIEKLTGHSYAHELQQRILGPLALGNTELPRTRHLPDLADDGYHPNVAWAAGGIVSNAHDLARFFSALLSGRILPASALAKMEETVVADDPEPLRAGLGIFSAEVRCGRSWGHDGNILDYVTFVRASEDGDRVGVISVRASRGFTRPDRSAQICPESRLAKSAANSKVAFIRTSRRVGDGPPRNELFVGNADGSGQRRLLLDVSPVAYAWSPDGGRIAFESRRDGNSEIYVMNVDGSGLRRLTRNAAYDALPAWSPDGRTIAFVRWRRGDAGDIYTMSADGTAQRRLTGGASHDNAPAWSPGGRTIVFEGRLDGDSEIYVVNADGSGLRNLTHNAFPDEDPAWSPDGRKIAFANRSHGIRDIYVMNADGSQRRSLTHDLGGARSPVWSPDGREIAFERTLASGGGGRLYAHFDVYAVHADGCGQPRPLTKDGRQPRWSLDGRMIAFVSSHDGNPEIYVMNADGSGQRNMTRTLRATESFLSFYLARPRSPPPDGPHPDHHHVRRNPGPARKA
jgi:Tol biopolymer transport system component/CubicO group peptidase (beta-lactamase class C family)